jgi:hypothetical protein
MDSADGQGTKPDPKSVLKGWLHKKSIITILVFLLSRNVLDIFQSNNAEIK